MNLYKDLFSCLFSQENQYLKHIIQFITLSSSPIKLYLKYEPQLFASSM